MRNVTWEEAAARIQNPALHRLGVRERFHLAKLLLANAELGDALFLAAIRHEALADAQTQEDARKSNRSPLTLYTTPEECDESNARHLDESA